MYAYSSKAPMSRLEKLDEWEAVDAMLRRTGWYEDLEYAIAENAAAIDAKVSY
jgi:hypothetical protein